MKNKSCLYIATAVGIVLSFGLVSFHAGETPPGRIRSSKSKPPFTLVSYRYDSVKVASTYRFDHAAAAVSQAYVRVVYPVFQHNALNDMIKSVVLSSFKIKYQFKHALNSEHPALSNMDAINNAGADYREWGTNFLRQFEAQAPQEDLKAYWYADIKVTVLTDRQDYVALLCKKDCFTGGSHDLYDHTYLNYDVRNHRVVALASQLKPDKIDQLTAVAERIFRKQEGLTSTQELDGYFFKNGKFSLPTNFTINGKGLMFFYDYYEIKPFAAGTTELVIPFAQVKDLSLPNSILADQMKK